MSTNVGEKMLYDLGRKFDIKPKEILNIFKDLFSAYNDNGDGGDEKFVPEDEDKKRVLEEISYIYKFTPLQQIPGYPLILSLSKNKILLNNIDIFTLLEGYTIPDKYLVYNKDKSRITLFKDIIFKEFTETDNKKEEGNFFVTRPTDSDNYSIKFISQLDNINTLESAEFFIIILHELGHYIDWKIGESQEDAHLSYSTRESNKYIKRQNFMPTIDRIGLESANEEIVQTSLAERNAHNIALSLLYYLYKNPKIGKTIQQYYPKEIVIPFMKKALITYALTTVKEYITYEQANQDNYSKVDFENYFGPINEGIEAAKGPIRRKLIL